MHGSTIRSVSTFLFSLGCSICAEYHLHLIKVAFWMPLAYYVAANPDIAIITQSCEIESMIYILLIHSDICGSNKVQA